MAEDDFEDDAIERWMRDRHAPPAPQGFTARVMVRMRQERWQVERYWDLGFNIAVAGGLLLIAAGVVGLVYLSGMGAVGRDAMLLFVQGVTTAAVRIEPVLPTYVGALVLTATALGLWWYVEN